MAQTVDVIDDPGTATWSHPAPGYPLELDPGLGVIGGGGGDSGGGGGCSVAITRSIVTGDVQIAVGPGGYADGSNNGSYSKWDIQGNGFPYANGGNGGGAGGSGAPPGSGDITNTGGNGSASAGGGAGGASPDAGGDNAVTITGGGGGDNGEYLAALHGGAGGNSGVAGHAPGGGGGLGQPGANGRIVVPYTIANCGITGDTGSSSVSSFNVNHATQDPGHLALIRPTGNPIPSADLQSNGDFLLFALTAVNGTDGQDGYLLQTVDASTLLAIGTYSINIGLSNVLAAPFIQNVTINVIGSSFNANSVAGSCSLASHATIPNTPPQIFQSQLGSPYGIF